VYIKVTAENGTTVLHYTVSVTRAGAQASTDAGLTSVLSQNISAGGEAGTAAAPKTATISVANSVATVGLGGIVPASNATFKLYSNADFSTGEVTGVNTIDLTEGATTLVYIKVTAENGTTELHYKVSVTRAGAQASTDAGLTSVLSQNISAGGEAGTVDAPKTATISVDNAVATVGLGGIAVADDATFKLYSDANFSTEITGVNTIDLSVGANDVYILVTAQDTTTKLYYKVTITRAAP
jgi:hypothetical protein